MTLSVTYQELRQLVTDKLNQDVELQYVSYQTIKFTLHTAIKKIVTINVNLSAEVNLSVYGTDLYINYKILPIENMTSGRLAGIIDSIASNVVNVLINHLTNKYPQYDDVVEKVPNANQLRVHLAAIPQLQIVLQQVEIDSIVSYEDGLQIIAHIKNK